MPEPDQPETSAVELITVVDHDPAWAAAFEDIRAAVVETLRRHDVPFDSVEHVGSTSVPGLPAKPIIDVDVVVATADHLPAATAALEAIGYTARGTMGVDQRWAFSTDELPKRNLYVTVAGCLSLRNHVGVRDVLRRDARLAAEYGALKRTLARQLTVDEIDRYVEAKSSVLQRVLAAAGLSADELDAIARANRADGPPVPASEPEPEFRGA